MGFHIRRAAPLAVIALVGWACAAPAVAPLQVPGLRDEKPPAAVCAVTVVRRSERDASRGTETPMDFDRWWFDQAGCPLVVLEVERHMVKSRQERGCALTDESRPRIRPPLDEGSRSYDPAGRLMQINARVPWKASEVQDTSTVHFIYDAEGRLAEEQRTFQRGQLYGRAPPNTTSVRYVYGPSCTPSITAQFAPPLEGAGESAPRR